MLSERKSLWELFGKISAILVAVTAAISIWTYFFPHAENIEVIGNYRAYRLPPDLLNMLAKFREGQDSSNIEDYLLAKQKNSKLDLTEDQISDVSSIIESMFESFWDDDFRSRIQKYDGFVSLNIENTGNKNS